MRIEAKSIRQLFSKFGHQTGLMVIILGALLLEAISGIQYYYTRGMLERNLEQQVLGQLMVSAYRLDGILNGTETSVYAQVWHAQQHLDDPEYMKTLVYNLVRNEDERIVGAAIAFRPNYYASKGYWYEPYARRAGDSITVEQIGSARHDYFSRELYQTCIKGDTLEWNIPYLDAEGAKGMVTTFAVPVRDEQGDPVAAFCVDITTEWISETTNRIPSHPSSFSMVMSEEGDLIALPEADLCSDTLARRIARMICDSTIRKEEKANGRVTGFKFCDEEKNRVGRVYYARKRVEPKWLMVMVCYDDEAFGELVRLRRHIVWLALAGLVILGIIVRQFVRNRNRLLRSQIKQERIDGELKIAKNLQTQMLPRENSIVHDDVKLHGTLIPAREVGGDLYDFFIRDEKLFFCIGDVSGKGVPAAFVMAVTQALFHNIASRESNPAHIMNHLNATVCRNNDSNMFVTLFVGVLDLPTGRLCYCNAGHEIPILIAQSSSALEVAPNLPIGLFDDFSYEMQETAMQPRSTLFLYTDGLTEARNAQRQMFGWERLVKMMEGCSGMSPRQMTDTAVAEVRKFSDHAEQYDDLTLLAISYTPMQENAHAATDGLHQL